MKLLRDSMRVIYTAIAVCIPFACLSQTVVATPPSLSPSQQASSPSREVAPDAAKRFEGRLFFSPDERQRMNDARKRGLVPGEDGQLVEPPASVLNGFVKRSDGNISVWVDGVPRWNAKSRSADNLMPSDVGGPAAYLKASSGESMAGSATRKIMSKKAVKPRAKKRAKPRLLP